MKKNKKPLWIAILCVCIAVVIGVGVYLFRYFTQKDIGRDDILPTVAASEAPTQAATAAPAPAPVEEGTVGDQKFEMKPLDIDQVNFDELMKINSDIYAWIYIPGTGVDYPVARAESNGDDSFYLEHNIYKQYQFSGTIYSEIKNNPDLHDRVTVLYGHNMLNGSMFASLHNYEDPSFFDEYNTIYMLTKDKVLTYLVYSAYTYDDRHILNTFNMNDDTIFQEYLNLTLAPYSYNENVREGVELNLDSRILTLSTCTNGAASTRYLVQGVLVDERDR